MKKLVFRRIRGRIRPIYVTRGSMLNRTGLRDVGANPKLKKLWEKKLKKSSKRFGSMTKLRKNLEKSAMIPKGRDLTEKIEYRKKAKKIKDIVSNKEKRAEGDFLYRMYKGERIWGDRFKI